MQRQAPVRSRQLQPGAGLSLGDQNVSLLLRQHLLID